MDNLITDLLAKRNFVQARKAIEKRLKQKKYEGDHSLIVAKAKALFGLAEYQACLELCTHLCQIGLYTPEDVNDIYALLHQLSHHIAVDEALYERLWRNAVAEQPEAKLQQEWREEWAAQAIRYQHWTQLIKAAMALKQSVSQGSRDWRKYSFWLIVAQWLASRPNSTSSKSNAVDDRMRVLNETLAVRQLQEALKTAEASTGQNGNSATSNKLRMEKLPELKLLSEVLKELGRSDDIVSSLSGAVATSLASNDDDLRIQLRDAVLATKSDEDAFQWLKDTLTAESEMENAASRVDDWQIWKALLNLKSCQSTDTRDNDLNTLSQAQDLARRHCNADKVSRGPRLADFELQCRQTADKTRLKEAFMNYFERYSRTEFVVDDLQRNLGALDDAAFQEVRAAIARIVTPKDIVDLMENEQLMWLTAEINTLKLDLLYLERTSSKGPDAITNGTSGSEESERTKLLEALAVNAIRVYGLSRAHTAKVHEKAMHPGDQACLVAVDALLKLGPLSKKISATTLQALCLLDFVLADNKHNFLARTQFTGLSQALGLHTLASQAYQALDVKEVLHETMSPLLFLRIGSTRVPIAKSFDSSDAMTKALEFYNKSLEKIPDYQAVALDHANYSQVIHMNQFREQLYLSPTRIMLLFERKRIARLLHDQLPGGTVQHAELELADELRAAYNGSAEVPKRAQPDRHPGPALTKQYTEWLMLTDLAFELARSKQLEKTHVETYLPVFKRLRSMLNERGTAEVLTDAELTALKVADCVFSVVLYLVGLPESEDVPTVDAALQSLQSVLITSIGGYTKKKQLGILPTWTDYHEGYLKLELCQVLDSLSDKLEKCKLKPTNPKIDNKVVQESAKPIKIGAKECFELVQQRFSQYRKDVTGYGNAQLLHMAMGGDEGETEEAVAKAVYEVMGVQNVKRFLQNYVLSATASIDALLSVKLRR